MSIAIVDYQMNNIRSVQKAFESLGVHPEIVTTPEALGAFDRIVIPGVGAFGQAMARLEEIRMAEAIRQAAASGKQILGICLGMQLLFDSSEEFGSHRGLGLLPGTCRRLPDSVRIPHVGWNLVEIVRPAALLDGIETSQYFYFVHSYCAEPSRPELVLATTEYGGTFPSIVGGGNVWGAQFHPEKSQKWGLQILANFARLNGSDGNLSRH